jgi:hypothetical protein
VRRSPLWQKLIWIVMFLVVYEGALRKWVFPGYQAGIFFVKDLILVLAYVIFLGSRNPPGAHLKVMAPLKVLLLLSVVYFLFELVNPNSPSVLVSISGLKSYLLYIPIAFLVPYMFTSSEDLEGKLRKYALLMIPCVALGLVQFALPPTHWLNGYLSHDSDALDMGAVFGSGIEKVRSIGTFSYIGGYTAFLTVMFYLVAGLVAKSRWKVTGNAWLLAYLVLTVAAMFTTGSRGPIWWLIATWPLALGIWGYAGLLSMGNVARMVLAAAVIWVLAQLLASDAFDAYSQRSEHAGDTITRVLAPLNEAWGALLVSGPIGTGMGSASGGALSIMGSSDFWWLNGSSFEVETARVVQETGIVGFILVYAMRAWLLVKAISLSSRFRNPLYVGLSGVIACLFLQDLALGFVINNATVGIYHWFAAGLLFAMYRLEVAEPARTKERPVRTYGRVTAFRRMKA